VHMQHWLGDRNRTAAPSSNKYYISKYLFWLSSAELCS
jgi:hypothetical protein